MGVFSVQMSRHHMQAWSTERPEESVRFPGMGVTDSCELPCRCWELNPGPLEEQPMLLATELSLQLLVWFHEDRVSDNSAGLKLAG